jgi:hypothetical protein
LSDTEAPTFFGSRLTDGGDVISLTCRPAPFPSEEGIVCIAVVAYELVYVTTLTSVYQITWCHIQEYRNLNRPHDNFKFPLLICVEKLSAKIINSKEKEQASQPIKNCLAFCGR